MNTLKILMADDEDEILEICSKKVRQAGYEVVTASDGEEAWLRIQEERPDMIVLDLTMPKMDGLEVLQKIRQQPSGTKWQPVIIVSARQDLTDFQKGYEMEADHYIAKPCEVEDILKAIRLMAALIPQHENSSESFRTGS